MWGNQVRAIHELINSIISAKVENFPNIINRFIKDI